MRWWGLNEGESYMFALRSSSEFIGDTIVPSRAGFSSQLDFQTSTVSLPEDIGKVACLYATNGDTIACCTIE